MWSLYSVYTHLTTLVRPCGDLVTPSGHLDHFGPAPVADLGTYLLGTHLRARQFATNLYRLSPHLYRSLEFSCSGITHLATWYPFGHLFGPGPGHMSPFVPLGTRGDTVRVGLSPEIHHLEHLLGHIVATTDSFGRRSLCTQYPFV